jgi:hypothetical protein
MKSEQYSAALDGVEWYLQVLGSWKIALGFSDRIKEESA